MSKNPAVLLLEHHLKELKLPTFLRDYDTRFPSTANASLAALARSTLVW